MKVWLAVCLTAALVGDGWGRTSIVDRIIGRRDAPDSEQSVTILGLLGASSLVDGSFVLSNTTTFKPSALHPYDVDADRSKAARSAGLMKLFAWPMKIGRKGLRGLGGKLKKMKGSFKNLYSNKISDKARAGWKRIKKTYDNVPDKSKILKKFLEEAWSLLGNFDLRSVIMAALAEMGMIPECACYLNDVELKRFKELIERDRISRLKRQALLRCGCCIKPFDWKSLCMLVKVNVYEQAFQVSMEFDGEEFLNMPIKFRKGDGGVDPAKSPCIPEHRLAMGQEKCAYLGDIPFVDICLRPREIEIHKDDKGHITSFGSCIQIVVDFLYFTYEKCFQYDVRARQLSAVDEEEGEEGEEE